MNAVSVVFDVAELWLMRSVVRHDMAQRESWSFPPCSLELNDQIAFALLLCEETNAGDAALELSREDCLLLDYCVPQDAKDLSGNPLGKRILLKSFKARRELADSLPSAPEPPTPTHAELEEAMDAWQKRQED